MKFSNKRQSGFSMVEMVVVMAVMLTVSATALPKVMQGIYNMRLRSAAFELSGLMQAARMQAVRDNTYYYVCTGTVGNSTRAWVSSSNACSTPTTERQVQFGGNVRIATSGQPSGLSTLLSFSLPTGTYASARPAFNGRGLPCAVVSSVCNTIVSNGVTTTTMSFVIYETDTRPVGSNGWAAITISPAGRTQVWMYNGSGWGR